MSVDDGMEGVVFAEMGSVSEEGFNYKIIESSNKTISKPGSHVASF